MEADATANAATPPSIGAALRAAREAAALTLGDIADRTKIRPGFLAAIEADDHEHLPSLTYTLGFVKAYARTVGLDPAAAAERYRRETDKAPPAPSRIDLQPLDARRLPSARLLGVSTAAVALLVGLFWAYGAGWFDAPLPPDPAAPTATAAAPPAAAALPPAPPPAANAQVVLTAREDAWLRIYDRISGRAVYQGTLAAGQSYTLPPPETGWLLRTGRAGAVQVTVGGRAIPPLGGPAEIIKHVPLDADALLARAAPAPAVQPPPITPAAQPAPRQAA